MKFQLKTLAVAAVLAVSAGQASAAIEKASNLTTGAELIFFAWDNATKTSYMKDLGTHFASFLPSNDFSFTQNVNSDASWATYVSNLGGNLAGTKWGVVGVVKGAAGTSDAVQMSFTARAGTTATAINNQLSGGLKNASATVDTLINTLNGSNTNWAENLNYFRNQTGTSGAALGNWANVFGSNKAGNITYNVDNAIGVSSSFNLFSAQALASAKTKNYAYDGGTFSFDGANLTYSLVSAVPEPSTYAMMAAGLMLVGGIAARRRNSAK